MWILIIVGIILVIIVIRFAVSSNRQANYVTKQGGMRNKYRTLVDYILSGDSRARIVQEKATFLAIVLSTVGGRTEFLLQQTFGKITIQWRMESPVFGKHKLEWSFEEFMDQNLMIEKIESDIGEYTKNILGKFM